MVTLDSAMTWPSRKDIEGMKEERGSRSVLLKGGPQKSQSPFHFFPDQNLFTRPPVVVRQLRNRVFSGVLCPQLELLGPKKKGRPDNEGTTLGLCCCQ